MVQVKLQARADRPAWYVAAPILFSTEPYEERRRAQAHLWRPPTDVYHTADTLFIRLEIAGMQAADFTITVQRNVLTVHGVRPAPQERCAYHQMEIRYGEFLSEVELPVAVVVAEAQAEYRDGFLTISLPRMKPRQIHITA
ncbi:MAG: Hsp20/alpha crystallin family protein [Anaerolineae bacterium]|nr:MAG: Hsp20/alpha crystallin family protein [Anaerolineae bacterium]